MPLRKGTAGVASTAAVAAPAVQTGLPAIKWRMTSSFPKSIDTLYGSAELLTNRLREITGGKFDIRVFPAGEIVPGLQALDAVQQGTVEMCHSCSYYYVGKDKTFAFGTAVPFGLNARQMDAWIIGGGGQELLDEFYSAYNVYSFLGGNTGVQMGGWYRKQINTLEDIKGLKIRIAGIGGEILSRMGAIPQQIAGSDIYPSLEKGTIDAAEWVAPYDDEKLGFYKVAPHYYSPGWWEPGPAVHFYVNKAEWEKLPKEYQAAFRAACTRGAHPDDRDVRPQEPAGARPPAGAGREAAELLERDHEEGLRRVARAVRRGGRQEPGLGQDLHRVREVPQVAERLVQRRRSGLRPLHAVGTLSITISKPRLRRSYSKPARYGFV